MPTQRPFFANFLAAFRAQSAITQQQTKAPQSGISTSSQPNHTSSPSSNPSSASTSHPRSIATATASKPSNAAGATTSALTQLHSPRAHSTSPLSRSPGPAAQGSYMQNAAAANENRMRRGSDSSSEGFRDVLASEKWYIGGRTATGEERFFKLGVVRRHRSIDRLSLDRLSL
jgi:hypothetical protein